MPQETNLNRSPYFDDFDPNKDFHKVLFKPGYSVQARELTTLQSILQNQIEKFGTHFFKEGARVIPGAISYSLEYRNVQIEPEFLGLPLSLYQDQLIGKQIRGSLSGVTATVKRVVDNTDTGNIILFVDYNESGDDYAENIFRNGENLVTLSDIRFGSNSIPSEQEFGKAIDSDSTSSGSAVFISEGVYFIRGYFVRVASQSVILDNFNTRPTYRVGLSISEELINSDIDESLYDNARGYSNYSAPGADRLKISTTLIKKDINDFNDQNFIELLRINNGVIEEIVNKTQYNIIAEELARRTYDESGDYYITPFDIIPRNTLNNKIDNNGLFDEGQLTPFGNIPSDNLMTYKISPGKAYIRGFEVIKDGQTFIDVDKPRTTASVSEEGISFNCGPSLFVDNSYGQPPVGLAITDYLSLRDSRLGSDKTSPAGSEIGIAKAYDYSIVGSTGITTSYELRLFDIQTFTKIGLSTNITLSPSSLIEGKTSGARGYLRSSVSGSTELVLQDVSGRFVKDENIVVSGISTYGQVIKSIRDYTLSDINSVFAYRSTSTATAGFNADLSLTNVVQPTLNIPNSSISISTPSFTISAKDPDTGISTVTSTTTNFIGVATVGNILGYAKAGFSTVTYNKIISISPDGRSVDLTSVTSVDGICDGLTAESEINTSELFIRTPKITNVSDPSLTTPLSKRNVSTIETENTDIALKRQYNIASFSSNSISGPTLDTDFTYLPFSNQRYSLCYSDGVIEDLSSDKFFFTNGFKNLEIKNLSVASGSNATLIITVKKSKVKEKNKKLNKVNSLVVSKSSNIASGTGNLTLNDGLTHGLIYGTRVQDKEISLNVAEVRKILAIFESSDVNDPVLPTMTFISQSLTGPNKIATDILIGDLVIGSESNAVGRVVSTTINSIEFVYLNQLKFTSSEIVSFKDSLITGSISLLTTGDNNISEKYQLDSGYRPTYYDFSRIVKIDSNFTPSKRIKIIFENYYTESSDVGDIYTVDSYPSEVYSSLPFYGKTRFSDLIDIRPRVSSYDTSSQFSPFDFRSRNFTGSGQSSQYQISPLDTFLVSFSYYLPRIDKIFLSKEGQFQLQRGISAEDPSAPKNVDGMLEIATISLPAYLYNISDAGITFARHKRYRMEDISRLEMRISNLEYYTQLSLLELATESLSIKTNGVDRFKCGFFVDNFKSHLAHNVTSPLFKSSIDKSKGYLRPSHYTTAIDLIGQSPYVGIGTFTSTIKNMDGVFDPTLYGGLGFGFIDLEEARSQGFTDADIRYFLQNVWTGAVGPRMQALLDDPTWGIITTNANLDYTYDDSVENQNIRRHKKIITLSYTNQVLAKNPFATRIENVTPFLVTSYTGVIELNPSSDTWIDTKVMNPNKVIIEGSYESTIQQLDVNPKTGFSEIDWGAWQTDWIGVDVSTNLASSTTRTIADTNREVISSQITSNNNQTQTQFDTTQITTTFNDTTTIRANTTATTNTLQSREGIRWNVTEQIDSQMLGARIVNNEFIKYMRPRNIEFISRKLKPYTEMYAFFDKVNVSQFCFPKLVEISMLEGTFIVGETVRAIDPTNNRGSGSFRVATANHKIGPYNSPIEIYTKNPYSPEKTELQSNYTSSSTILNIDTSSLQEASIGSFFGRIKRSSILVGSSSGARARVSSIKLITDEFGTLIGSFFIPRRNETAFETGIKSFRLSNNPLINSIPGTIDSFAEENFYSQGVLQTSQDTNLGIRNARVRKDTFSDTRTLTSSNTSSSEDTFITSSSSTATTTATTTTNTITTIQSQGGVDPDLEYMDPLAQSFFVNEQNGVFVTKLDLYFYNKPDANIPVIVQLRPLENGIPTKQVLPFSEVHLLPENIITSRDASIASVIYFDAPIYLENGKEYAIVLLSDSTEYQVWISRMGEEDLTGAAPSPNNPIPELSLKDMSGFDTTLYGELGFGLRDLAEARAQGFSDSDIRYFLENQHQGVIGPEMRKLLNDSTWGRPYLNPTPFGIKSMVGFNPVFQGEEGFGMLDYEEAIRQGFNDSDIRYYLETVWSGRIGPKVLDLLNDPNWGRITYNIVSSSTNATTSIGTRKIVSQQPILGSLFKSQNASTWEPSGYEDLKFTLYKAQFTTNPGFYSFYNPEEGGEYNTLAKLKPETIGSISNKIKIGLSTSITYPGIVPGVSIGITDKTIRGNLIGIAGSVSTIDVSGIGLTSYSVGSGYTTFRYNNLELSTITGEGSGLIVDAYFVDGKLDVAGAGIVTVREGGYGYRIGDIVGIPTAVSFGSGARLSVQSISSFNTLILDNVQGNYDNVIGKRLTYEPFTTAGISSYVGLATVSYIEQNTNYDGLHLRIHNKNHGIYSSNNVVRILNIKSDLKTTKLTNSISNNNADIALDSISIFNNFENVGVSSTNPGYIRIQNELIQYTGVNGSNSSLTGITRGIDAYSSNEIGNVVSHDAGEIVEKYEFNGVSLRRINKLHNLSSPLATVDNPIDIDDFYIKIDMSDTNYGVNRNNNLTGIPNLYFNESKNGSNFNSDIDDYVEVSQNIVFSSITPNVNVFTPKGTAIGSRIRTISGSSVDGNEVSFEDLGFESVQLNSINDLSSVRMIASKDNEISKLSDLPGNKSFTLNLDLFTADPNVSPVIDMERVSMILTSNRINNPITSWPGESAIASEMRKTISDPNASVYVSNKITLANPSTSLKVLLAAYRPSTSDIRVMYRLYRADDDNTNSTYEFFPGYENFNSQGSVINPENSNGNSDIEIIPNMTKDSFSDYEYSVSNLPSFDGFEIKIIMTGTDQSKVPLIKDLRAIALA